jgi:hypothetical protein
LKSEQFFKIYYFILNNFFHQITNYWNVHVQSAREHLAADDRLAGPAHGSERFGRRGRNGHSKRCTGTPAVMAAAETG